MEEHPGDSHATEAHESARSIYKSNMVAETTRFGLALAAVHTEHEANVKSISESYTDALAEADAATAV